MFIESIYQNKRGILFLVLIIILSSFISANENSGGYLDVESPPQEEKSSESTKNQCEQLGGACKCACDKVTEFGGYGKIGCASFGCGMLGLSSKQCCKLKPEPKPPEKEKPPPTEDDCELKLRCSKDSCRASMSSEEIEKELQRFNSPAEGLGQFIYDKGREYGIDPVFAYAWFRKETGLGGNDGAVTARRAKSMGNIIKLT